MNGTTIVIADLYKTIVIADFKKAIMIQKIIFIQWIHHNKSFAMIQ